MEDINYNEIFGLEESEETQEAAEPAETQAEEIVSEEEPEVAEPAVEEGPEETKGEEDSKYAAARRKAEAERDAAISKAKQDAAQQAKDDAEKYINEAIKALGLTNPYTKAPIETKADYDAYRDKYTAEKKSGVMKKTGMNEAEFTAFISELPEVKEAAAKAQAAAAAQEQARRQMEQAEIERQMENIRKLDPTIKTAADILKMDTADVFREKVARGYTFEDAFRLANSEKLLEAARQSAKQAALNAGSKDHMSRTQSRGSGMEPVPAEVMAEYKEFMPDATEEEIRKHYNKYLKR